METKTEISNVIVVSSVPKTKKIKKQQILIIENDDKCEVKSITDICENLYLKFKKDPKHTRKSLYVGFYVIWDKGDNPFTNSCFSSDVTNHFIYFMFFKKYTQNI